MDSFGSRDLAACSAGTDPKRTITRQVTRFVTNRTSYRLTSMEHKDREIDNGHRRRNGTTERHYETTGAIGHRRKLAEETGMNTVGNTKGFKHGPDIIVGHFKRQITNKDETNGLVGNGSRNREVTKEERRSLTRSSRYSEVLQVTRTRPPLKNWTAAIFSTSRARSNCGAASETP